MPQHARAAFLSIVIAIAAACAVAPTPQPPATSYSVVTLQIAAGVSAEAVNAAQVTPDFFPATKTQPILGRAFTADDFRPGASSVVMLSYTFWQRAFQNSPEAIGRAIDINGRPAVVIAVMPDLFNIPKGAEVWVPKGGGMAADAVSR